MAIAGLVNCSLFISPVGRSLSLPLCQTTLSGGKPSLIRKQWTASSLLYFLEYNFSLLSAKCLSVFSLLSENSHLFFVERFGVCSTTGRQCWTSVWLVRQRNACAPPYPSLTRWYIRRPWWRSTSALHHPHTYHWEVWWWSLMYYDTTKVITAAAEIVVIHLITVNIVIKYLSQ